MEDAVAAAEAGADMLGFIFAPTRRQVSREVARDIIAEVRRHYSGVKAVGVFVDASLDAMNEIVRFCNLDLVQLSGSGPNEVIDALDVPAIKVLHVGERSTPDALRLAACSTSAKALLLDTGRPGVYGGTGETFDWNGVPPLNKPFLLAGGLGAHNVAYAVEAVKPWGVDVSSGVETAGDKDPEKIRAFLVACRS